MDENSNLHFQDRKKVNTMNERTISIILFIAGLITALTSATLLFFGILPSSTSAIIGIIGIGLLATSNFRLLK
jgi:phosphate/sulfate permease